MTLRLKFKLRNKSTESGFDIIPNKNFFPYFAFVNGPQNIKKNKIKLEIINYKVEI